MTVICPVCKRPVTMEEQSRDVIIGGKYAISREHIGWHLKCSSDDHYVLFSQDGRILYYKNYSEHLGLSQGILFGLGIQLGLVCI